MYILLILYFIFLLIYIAFNTYFVFRVYSMRIKGDLTMRGIIVYLFAVTIVLVFSIFLLTLLRWNQPLFNLGGRFAT